MQSRTKTDIFLSAVARGFTAIALSAIVLPVTGHTASEKANKTAGISRTGSVLPSFAELADEVGILLDQQVLDFPVHEHETLGNVAFATAIVDQFTG